MPPTDGGAVLTIGRLAERFGLSRSTLLYYDSIGLLSPSERSAAGYRLYSEADVHRMERIDVYRRAGLPLAEIAQLLDGDRHVAQELLEGKLRSLNREIGALRRQQQRIVVLLRDASLLRDSRHLDKAAWVKLLEATGLDDAAMRRWHVEFERSTPEAHQDFLESLGLSAEEIGRIRRQSQSGFSPPQKAEEG